MATQDHYVYNEDPRALSPVALAFVGDAVYELMVRRALLLKGNMPAGRLHKMAVERVSAAAQAGAWDVLVETLSEEEAQVLRRGRNAHTARVPRNATPEEYRKATALEALWGYLYLKGELGRLEELFDRIESARETAPTE